MPLEQLLIPAGIQLGTSLLGGMIGSQGSNEAAAAQAKALQDAIDYQKGVYGDTKANLTPWVNQGQSALGSLASLVGGMRQPGFSYQQQPFSFDPNTDKGAQYAMDQATQAINASSLAKGGMGGGVAKAINADRTNNALMNYNNKFNQWMGESGMRYGQAEGQYNRDVDWQRGMAGLYGGMASSGQQAAQGLGSLANVGAGALANTYGSLGSAQGGGALGSANAWGGSLNQIGTGLSKLIGDYYGRSQAGGGAT